MAQSTRDGTSRYRIIMLCYFPSPPYSKTPTIQTARMCTIIICIFREKAKRARIALLKMISKISNVAILAYFMSKFSDLFLGDVLDAIVRFAPFQPRYASGRLAVL